MNAEITDEQIHALRERAMFSFYSTHAGTARDARYLVALCDRALARCRDARIRCAEILRVIRARQ